MKTHRPWQPHMSSTPLFNPYTPAGRATTLDHFDLVEEEADAETSDEPPEEQAGDSPPTAAKRG
jgi:hypothetical protein